MYFSVYILYNEMNHFEVMLTNFRNDTFPFLHKKKDDEVSITSALYKMAEVLC